MLHNIGPNNRQPNQPTNRFRYSGISRKWKTISKRNWSPKWIWSVRVAVPLSLRILCVRFCVSFGMRIMYISTVNGTQWSHINTHTHRNLAPSVNWSYLSAAGQHILNVSMDIWAQRSVRLLECYLLPFPIVRVLVCVCVFGLHFHWLRIAEAAELIENKRFPSFEPLEMHSIKWTRHHLNLLHRLHQITTTTYSGNITVLQLQERNFIYNFFPNSFILSRKLPPVKKVHLNFSLNMFIYSEASQFRSQQTVCNSILPFYRWQIVFQPFFVENAISFEWIADTTDILLLF